ncbi:MAG: glycosyltransferase family 4 protein [Bryobacterales bacterium]|nr:glycosyltransferase family 4 protein [Bryobacterales bacterium]
MRVVLDATPLTLSSGGLRRYTLELAQALAAAYPEDEYWLASDQPFDPPPGLHVAAGPASGLERRWWAAGLPRRLRAIGADVFHGTDFSVPYVPVSPAVITLHDLSPWMNPAWHTGAERVRQRTPWLLRLGLASRVVTHSEAVRKQVVQEFHVPPERTAAVPLAAPAHWGPQRDQPAAKPYFLYCGTIEPRKNVTLLIDAWRAAGPQSADLVLAGRRRADGPEVPDLPGLRWLGEVEDAALPALYSNALAFLYPSLYEGFGLPVLEAMQCGACVVTSTDPAIGEVCGDAAIRLNPRDLRSWVEALQALVTRPEMAAPYRAAALVRARQFSWARTARLTHDVYADAIRDR